MEMERVSKELYEQLMRRGLRGGTAGTVEPRGKGAGRAAGGGVTRPATAGGGAPADLGVEKAIEAAIRNGTGRIVRYVPLLIAVLEGGRK